ncbi:MAG TPA: hypothetical protein VFU21_00305 [Kofleriaceae bacterium]|nr:hypothetical protein [Kofleriaceae bacterium]
MKRAMGYGIVVLLLAFAVGCKKDKKKDGETPATDDKAGEATPTGGDMKAGEATPPAGGEATPPAGGTAMAPADMCKKIEEMAMKEGGKAKDMWDKNLKSDCEKEMNEAKTKDEAKYNEFVACVQGKATLTEAMENCKQIN